MIIQISYPISIGKTMQRKCGSKMQMKSIINGTLKVVQDPFDNELVYRGGRMHKLAELIDDISYIKMCER